MSFTKSMLALAVMAVSFTSHAAKQADLMIVDGTVLTICLLYTSDAADE